jgi:hypothetical protein
MSLRFQHITVNCPYLGILCPLRYSPGYVKIVARVPRRVVLATHRLLKARARAGSNLGPFLLEFQYSQQFLGTEFVDDTLCY